MLVAKQALDATPLITDAEYLAALAARESQGNPAGLVSPASGERMVLRVPLACDDVPRVAPDVQSIRLIATFADTPPDFDDLRLLRDAQRQAAACLEAQGVEVSYETQIGLDGIDLGSGRPAALLLELIPAVIIK